MGPGPAGGGTSGRGGARGSDRPSGGHSGSPGRNGPSGASKGSQAGSGGSGRSGGRPQSETGGQAPNGPASTSRAERTRGRQERAGARQTARQERHTAGHAAGIADRTRDRDQARAHRQKEWEDRRARRAERDQARRAQRDAAAASTPHRTTLGQAVAEEARRRLNHRRTDTKPTNDARHSKDAKDATEAKAAKEAKSSDGSARAEKTRPTKDKAKPKNTSGNGRTDNDGSDTDCSTAKDDDGSGDSAKRRRFRRWLTGAGRAGRRRRSAHPGRRRRDRTRRPADSPFGAQNPTPTAEWPDHPARPPRTDNQGNSEDGIVDADIVPDSPADATASSKDLPPTPPPHTTRPNTSQPGTGSSSMSSSEVSSPPGAGGLSAQHRTDITFDDYLIAMASTAIRAASHQERAEALAQALGHVADALRDMAADLVDDHNIDPRVTSQITDLADAAGDMKIRARRCAEQSGLAKEAARLAATMVARVYGEDMAAKDDAGLKHTSAAAHHD
ncbi:ATP/GTP-binding protein [Streptomyces sp. NPDC058739]|uniref:ATP/GTP-binding protein n=1 Tax=Streptomyces sp. NPDC058739 TaxID=3346618 RepID=UPI0036D13845